MRPHRPSSFAYWHCPPCGGQSKRMGCNKQLLPWRGKTVLDAVCGALQGGWGGQAVSTMSCKLPFVAVTGR